jgi:hypothetical protein
MHCQLCKGAALKSRNQWRYYKAQLNCLGSALSVR